MSLEDHLVTFFGFVGTAFGGYSSLLWAVSRRWSKQEQALESLQKLFETALQDMKERIEITNQTIAQIRALPLHAHRLEQLESKIDDIPKIQQTLASLVERVEDVKSHCRERHSQNPISTKELR